MNRFLLQLVCLLLPAASLCAATNAHPENHWSFQPITRPALPRVANSQWGRSPIDTFVLAKLEKSKIAPAHEAEKAVLIRRLYFDLIGLPPTPAQVRAFLQDTSSNSYAKLVDELLSSPHFGERWGRHWLDLARYADSDGYEKDGPRPYAYLYRDWVINAINDDMPYDQFSIEQLAGDLLPNSSLNQKIATGFHRNTLKNLEGGVDQEEFRCKAVVDRVSATSTIWLGLTAGCAECHNHKYDPISQREFYQLFAFFNNADEADIPIPTPNEQARYDKAIRLWQNEQNKLSHQLANSTDAFDSYFFIAAKLPLRPTTSIDLFSPTPPNIWRIALKYGAIKKDLAAHTKRRPLLTERKAQALVATEKRRETHIHTRGDFLRPGEKVEAATFAILHPFHPSKQPADRLDLARWLFDPANPLTARVAVNEIWRHLFGKGLVATENDFGARGEPPSHPELLDWLASEYQKLGWKRKELIRLIVTSSTYRQSSAIRPELADIDPENRLLARQNRLRLEAETLRDNALAVSGMLSTEIGGPSIRPPLPADIAAVAYAGSVKWNTSPGSAAWRRGLYIFFQRTVPYPMLIAFDAPDSNSTCTRRERSNTPIQALTLLNDPVFFECAKKLGEKFTSADCAEKEAELFFTCLGRPPMAEEEAKLREMQQTYMAMTRSPAKAFAALARSLMNLDEFVTRE